MKEKKELKEKERGLASATRERPNVRQKRKESLPLEGQNL